MPRILATLIAALYATTSAALPAADFPRFHEVVIDPEIGKVCYAVLPADVNGDRRPDIVAVSENRVQWYENPSWTKHVILEDQVELDHVCLAPHDIDGDGQLDFALGAGWTKLGTLYWISRRANPDEKWQVHSIGKETWLHRMSFADVLGTGRPQLVISPLNKTVGDGVRLTAFEIPAQPATDRWQPTILDHSLDRIHGHFHIDWDGDSRIDTLTASQEGVSLIRKTADSFSRTPIGAGAAAEKPDLRGAGELKVGKLPDGQRFIATVEPMHGTSVAIYTVGADPAGPWNRLVIENGLKQGHAVWTANLDADLEDEVIVGHREAGAGPQPGPGLYVYDCEDQATGRWKKHIVDHQGVAVEDAFGADLNGDGRIDLVAGGRATHNVKLYLNEGPAR